MQTTVIRGERAMYFKLMMRAPFSLKAIYQLRKAPFALTFVVSLALGVLHFTPHSFAFIGLDPYVRHIEQLWEMTPDRQEKLIQSLPFGCGVQALQLSCDEEFVSQIDVNFYVLVNFDDLELENGLILMSDHFIFVVHGNREMFSYHQFDGISFHDLQNHAQGYDILISRIATNIRTVWIVPFVLGSYVTGIVSYLGYIIIVSILSMLLKFGHSIFLKYREVLNILVFSSIPTVLFVIVIGFIMPTFSVLIFNLATPVVGWFVYKKYVVSGLQDMDSHIKERDFKGVV